MRLEETIEIKADAAKVWSFVGDISQWHYFVSQIRGATPGSGKRFVLDHERGPVAGELLDGRWEKEIGVRLLIKGREAKITYSLEETGAFCRVAEIQEFRIPFPVNLLIGWLHRKGRRTGPSNLENLKRIVESTF